MSGRIRLLIGVLLITPVAAHAQVGARDFLDRVKDHQRVMWRYQYNIAFQMAYQNPFGPVVPVMPMQQMQSVYWQQLHHAGYLPPVPPPPLAPIAPGHVRTAPDEQRTWRDADRVSFREAPGLRALELGRLLVDHRPELARQFFRQAIEEAGQDSPIAQLARQELRRLDGQ